MHYVQRLAERSVAGQAGLGVQVSDTTALVGFGRGPHFEVLDKLLARGVVTRVHIHINLTGGLLGLRFKPHNDKIKVDKT